MQAEVHLSKLDLNLCNIWSLNGNDMQNQYKVFIITILYSSIYYWMRTGLHGEKAGVLKISFTLMTPLKRHKCVF